MLPRFVCREQRKLKEIDIIDQSRAEEVIQWKKDAVPYLSQESIDKIDTTQEYATEKLISAATWLDSFFDDTRSESEENRTTARLKLSAGITDTKILNLNPGYA